MPAALATAEGIAWVDCTTAEGMIADLAAALDWQRHLGFLPQGLNLDALADALHHEPSPSRPRLTLVFTNVAALTARDPRRAALLPEVIADRARDLADTGLHLQALLIQSPFQKA